MAVLLRWGLRLEYTTLGWNVVGIVVLAWTAIAARSVALAGFGLDSLIEIGASTVVVWELHGSNEDRQRRGLRLIGTAFVLLVVYLAVQATVVLITGHRAHHSLVGVVWTGLTAAVAEAHDRQASSGDGGIGVLVERIAEWGRRLPRSGDSTFIRSATLAIGNSRILPAATVQAHLERALGRTVPSLDHGRSVTTVATEHLVQP